MQFSKGPDRFVPPKEITPGPGAYDPKLLSSDIGFKDMGRQAGERFSSDDVPEGSLERPDMSPPRERKVVMKSINGREYSATTIRIHELTVELDAARAKLKEHDKVVKELTTRLQKEITTCATAVKEKEQLELQLRSAEGQRAESAQELAVARDTYNQLLLESESQKKANNKLTQDRDELLLKNKDLGISLKELEAWKEEAMRNLQQATEQQEVLKKQLESAESATHEAQLQVQELHNQVDLLQEQIVSGETTISSLQTQIDEVRQQARATSMSLEMSQKQAQELSSQINAKNDSLETLRVELSKHVAQGVTAALELEHTQLQLGETQQQVARSEAQLMDLGQQLQQRESDLISKDQLVHGLQANVASLEESSKLMNQQLSLTATELEAQRLSTRDLQQLLAQEQIQAGGLREELTEARDKLQEAGEQLQLWQQELASAAVIHTDLVREHDCLKLQSDSQISDLKSERARVSELEHELDATQRKADGLTQQLQEATLDLGSKQQEVDQSLSRLSNLETLLEQRQAEVQDLNSMLQNAEEQMTGLRSTISQLQVQVDEKCVQMVEKQAQINDMNSKLSSKGQEISSLELRLREETHERDGLQGRIRELETQLASSTALAMQQQADLERQSQRLEDQATEINALQTSLAMKEGQGGKLLAAIDEHLSSIKALELTIAQQAQEAKALRSHNLSLKTSFSEQELQLQQQAVQLSEQQCTITQLNKVLVEHEQTTAAAAVEHMAEITQMRLEASLASTAHQSELQQLESEGKVSSLAASEREARLQLELQDTRQQLTDNQQSAAAIINSKEQTLQAAVASHEQVAMQMRLQVDAALASDSAAQQKIKDLNDQVAQLMSTISCMHAQMQATALESEQLRAQGESATAALASVSAKLSASETAVQSAEASLASTRISMSALSDELDILRDENHQMTEQVGNLHSQLTSVQVEAQEAEGLRQEVAETQQHLMVAEEKVSQLRLEVEELKTKQVSMTPILANAKLDTQLRALTEELQKTKERKEKAELEAAMHQHAAQTAETAVLEMQRLYDENQTVVACNLRMEENLNELLGKTNLGHANQKQKIQYHLRLKQELEEMRHECTVLLRERFHLEQCIRYLSVRARLPSAMPQVKAIGTAERTAARAIMPNSLTQSTAFLTPIGQKSMKLGARAKGCEQGTVYSTGKDCMENAITDAKRKTIDEVYSWSMATESMHTPLGRSMRTTDDLMVPSETSDDMMITPPPKIPDVSMTDMSSLEARIMAKIAGVCAAGTKPSLTKVQPSAGSGTENEQKDLKERDQGFGKASSIKDASSYLSNAYQGPVSKRSVGGPMPTGNSQGVPLSGRKGSIFKP